MRSLFILFMLTAVVVAFPKKTQRIVGGTITTIASHPSIVSPQWSWGSPNFIPWCGGTIVNSRSIVTAAHCTEDENPIHWRIRVGSTFKNSGGIIYFVSDVINHPGYNPELTGVDNDISILRTSTLITYVENAIQPAPIAGPDYYPPDHDEVWAAGWGAVYFEGPGSEQLRHVQIWVVNQEICRQRLGLLGGVIQDSMLCAGWLDVGGRDQCQGDSGGPVYHNGDVLVGVTSWGEECAHPTYPGVNTRVSSFSNWIVDNS